MDPWIKPRIGVVLCLLSCLLAAQEAQIYELGQAGVEPPRIVKRINPNYEKVRGVSATGSVSIGLIVTAKGLPEELRVVKKLEPEVDRAAMEAVGQWRFAPARKDGKPVAVRLTIELEFRAL